MRLFSALRISASAHNHLDNALEPFRIHAGTNLRWIPPENWHITLAFYGNRPDGHIDEIVGYLASVAQHSSALTLSLNGAGSFDNRNLWIGVGGDTDRLRALMDDCRLDDTERRRNRAHLTIARQPGQAHRRARQAAHRRSEGRDQLNWNSPVFSLSDAVRALAVYSGPQFCASSLCVVKSTLGAGRSGASLYETIVELPLDHGAENSAGHSTA